MTGPIMRERCESANETLSGPQVIRRDIANCMGLQMGPTQLAKYALDERAAEAQYESVRLQQESEQTATLTDLYEAMKELIAPQLHARCAEVLAACTSIRRKGCVAELRMFALADESRRKREIDRRPRTVTEALALARELDELAATRAP